MSLYFVRTVLTGQGCSKWNVLNKICENITHQFPDIGEIKQFPSRNMLQRIIRHLRENLIAQADCSYISSLTNASERNRTRSESLGVTLSVGEPDYQPIMLLERAFRSGAAVCRLMRSFEITDLQDLIGRLNPTAYPEVCRALEKTLTLTNGYILQQGFSNFVEVFNSPTIQRGIVQNHDQLIPIPYATGFLVGRNYLLTNHHVLNEIEKDSIKKFRAQFRYERDLYDRRPKPIEYRLDANFCISDPELDFTLVALEDFTADTVLSEQQQHELTEDEQKQEIKQLKDQKLRDANLSFEKAGDNFGWFWMNPNHTITPPISRWWIRRHFNQLKQSEIEPEFLTSLRLKGCLGEPVCIIQHPRGREKQIVLFNNRVTEVLGHSILYEADADFGSSGSPILNTDFRLAGIHSGAVLEYSRGKGLSVYANVGTSVPSIVETLKQRNSTEKQSDIKAKLNEFLIHYVDVPHELRQRRIFLSGGRQRGIPGEAELTSAIVKEIVRLSKGNPVKAIDVLASIPDEFRQQKRQEFVKLKPEIEAKTIELKTAIAWINNTSSEQEEHYQPGDVALELLTDRYDQSPAPGTDPNSLQRGFSAYYIANNQERRSHADLLLESLLDIPSSVSLGARSDMVASSKKMAFCRDIYMPSLVLYLGFLENKKDQEILGFQPSDNSLNDERIQALAALLYEGLTSWSKALSPISF